MKVAYKNLFDLEVFHEYYTHKVSHDLMFSPTASCKKLMAGYRLRFSPSSHGFRVAYPVQDGTPFIEIRKPVHFSFAITLKNIYLSNFTQLPQEEGHVHYFSDQEIADKDLKPVQGGAVPATKKHLYHYYAPKKVIAERYLGADQLTDRKQAFGYLSLHQPEMKDGQNAISFQTQSKVWRYYVILPATVAKDQAEYVIQKERDKATVPVNRYSSLAISFSKKEEKPWREGRKMLLFESEATGQPGRSQDQMPVPFYEEGLKNLRLIEKSQNGEQSVSENILIQHLPNPSIKNLKPEVFLYL